MKVGLVDHVWMAGHPSLTFEDAVLTSQRIADKLPKDGKRYAVSVESGSGVFQSPSKIKVITTFEPLAVLVHVAILRQLNYVDQLSTKALAGSS